MSEATIQADLQRELLGLTSIFSAGDVVIENYRILDGSSAKAPFAIIEASDDFAQESIETEWATTWQIPFVLIVAFKDWNVSRLALQSLRQSVIDALTDTAHYDSASVTLAWGLRGISAGTGISEIHQAYEQNPVEALPTYLSQRIILAVEETSGG